MEKREILQEKTDKIKIKEDDLIDLIDNFARDDTDKFFDLSDEEKRKLYTDRITILTITDHIMDVRFITGKEYFLDIETLPANIIGGMEVLKKYREILDENLQVVNI